MDVLLVNGNPVAPDPRATKVAKSLARNGYNVNILAWDRVGLFSKIERNVDFTIYRFQFKSPSGQLSLVFYLPVWWLFEFSWLIRQKWDIVHVADFVTLLPALIASKLKRKLIIYDIYDFYADNAPPSTPRLFRYFISNLDKLLMKFVDCIIIVDESRYPQIGNNSQKAIVITNSPEDALKNGSISESKKRNDKFLIFYAGHLSRERGFLQIISAIIDMDDVQLVIAGFGKDEHELLQLFSRSKNVKYIGRISYEDVIRWSLKADLLFALYDTIVPNNKYASPNKLFEAMMCGKPILVNKGTAMAEIVSKENCGLVVNYNKYEIKKAIELLKYDPTLCVKLGNNGRKAYEIKYDWSIMEGRLLNLYHNLTYNSYYNSP